MVVDLLYLRVPSFTCPDSVKIHWLKPCTLKPCTTMCLDDVCLIRGQQQLC